MEDLNTHTELKVSIKLCLALSSSTLHCMLIVNVEESTSARICTQGIQIKGSLSPWYWAALGFQLFFVLLMPHSQFLINTLVCPPGPQATGKAGEYFYKWAISV